MVIGEYGMRQVRTLRGAAALAAFVCLLFGSDRSVLLAGDAAPSANAEGRSEPELSEILLAAARQTEQEPVDVSRIVRVLQKGTSSRSARRTALERLPLRQLSAADRQRADAILGDISLFRELPVVSVPLDHNVFRYFSHRPDVAVSIWRAMDISKLKMQQVNAKDYTADAGDGTLGDIHFAWRGDDSALVLCDGVYNNPLLLRPIRAHCLLHVESTLSRRRDGEPFVSHRTSLFVAFPSQSVGTVARIVSPVTNRLLDRNVSEISAFLHLMSTAMQTQPGFVERLAGRLQGLPEGRPDEFLRLSARVYVQHQRREATARGQSPDSLPLPATAERQSGSPLR